ncbi:Uma2 family endonuclease [Streptomyces sp. 16-176A]|uniref:Uma2 family endonuclease n=1 Tax=Streptomyces sp. 16-176A TaxID=2530458 RepID=UPI00345D8F40
MGTPEVHWPVPPPGGFTLDHLLAVRQTHRHTELIDASLVLTHPPSSFHTDTVDLLVTGLRATAPDDLKVRRELTVVLDRCNAPAPDIGVIRAGAVTERDRRSCAARDLLLAVEVVSPGSASLDRTTKPHKYAAAGIENFWRVEEEDDGTIGRPVVHVYELDPVTGRYIHAGLHRDQIKVTEPYDIDIDLTAFDRI